MHSNKESTTTFEGQEKIANRRKYVEVFDRSALLLGVFIFDLLVPIEIAVGVLYVSCIILLNRISDRMILLSTVITSVLIIVTPFLKGIVHANWMIFANRGITLFAIWVFYFIVFYKNDQ